MANPLRRASINFNTMIESSDGTSISTSKMAGSGGATDDLMVYIWGWTGNSAMVSNDNGYTELFSVTSAGGYRLSVWTKINDGSETGSMSWTLPSGYDDGGFLGMSFYNVHNSSPIADYDTDYDTSGDKLLTTPAVAGVPTTELYKLRIALGLDDDTWGDVTGSNEIGTVQFSPFDSTNGGGLTASVAGGTTGSTNSYDIDTETSGDGNANSITSTIVIVGQDAYPVVDLDGFEIMLGAPF